jgi:hypothetical protein
MKKQELLKDVRSPASLDEKVLQFAQQQTTTSKTKYFNGFYPALAGSIVAGLFGFYLGNAQQQSAMQSDTVIIHSALQFRGNNAQPKSTIVLSALNQQELQDLAIELTMQKDYTQAQVVLNYLDNIRDD